MKHKLLVVLISVITIANVTASSADESINKQWLKEQSTKQLINSFKENELLKRQIAYELAPIKNKADLDILVSQPSSLDLLSPDAKSRFIQSIRFGDKGLAGFYYADLENELSFTQIHQVLSLFGAQHLVPMFPNARVETAADTLLKTNSLNTKKLYGIMGGPPGYPEYACIGRGTCRSAAAHICTNNC